MASVFGERVLRILGFLREQGDLDKNQLRTALGLRNNNQLNIVLKMLRQESQVHVVDWRRQPQGRPAPVFRLGPGRNAPYPPALKFGGMLLPKEPARRAKLEAYRKAYREQHRDVIREQAQQYHQDHKEDINARHRRYHHANKEAIRTRQREWRLARKLAKQRQTPPSES